MIWFNIKELEHKLKNEEISDKEAFNYLLANWIIISVIPYLGTSDYSSQWFLVTELVVTITTLVIGMKMTFDINTAGDNKDYLKRFISLSFVTGIRLVVFAIVIIVPKTILMITTTILIDETINDLLDATLLALLNIFYYYTLVNSFKRVNK